MSSNAVNCDLAAPVLPWRSALSTVIMCLSVLAPSAEASEVSAPFQPPEQQVPAPLPVPGDVGPWATTADRAIIGADNRVRPQDTTQYPYRAIGLLVLRKADGSFEQCTGTLISPRHVLTAAHCLVEKDLAVDRVYFAPGADGDREPYGRFEATQMYVPGEWQGFGGQETNPDIAMLRLAEPIGDSLGYLGVAPYEPSDALLDALSAWQERKPDDSSSRGDGDLTGFFHDAVQRFPEARLEYYGYSFDTNKEPWGDRCVTVPGWIDWDSPDYPQLLSFCDWQAGSSGAVLFDAKHLARAVVSGHAGVERSAVRDSEGLIKGYRGKVGDVQNIAVGLSEASVYLLDAWMKGREPAGTRRIDLPGRTTFLLRIETVGCAETVFLALHIQHPERGWESKGFFPLEPGRSFLLSSASPVIYYWAGTASGREWAGDADYREFQGRTLGLQAHGIVREEAPLRLDCQ